MDYEKKYKEAINRAKAMVKVANSQEEIYNSVITIFPELKESEDEKIKHEIKVVLANTDLSQFALEYTFADMLAWLEKQGEQKHAWSEDDKRILDALISSLINERFAGRLEFLKGIKVSSVIDWLKSLRPQPKQEWSEEDQNALEDVREAVVHYWGGDSQDILLYWLKSIKQKLKGE